MVVMEFFKNIAAQQNYEDDLGNYTLIDWRHSSESSISADICLNEASYAIDLE